MNELSKYAPLYKDELLQAIIPFWANRSIDREYGGYYTCLDREGHVFDTDKFIWLQGRQVWLFSMIYNRIEKKEAWLALARSGAEFMKKYGRDSHGDWYFSLTREGRPLVQPYNIFSDCFACMAFGELYKATGEAEHKQIALEALRGILRKKENPKGIYNKTCPGTRPMKSLGLSMILSNLLLVLEGILPTAEVDRLLRQIVEEIMTYFYKEEYGLMLENVAPDGSLIDSFEGRLINPGHVNEATWFLLDIARRFKDEPLAGKAVSILLHTISYGWDKEYGGIFYFKDRKGCPPQQLEWDQKLWWVHLETLISLAKGYKLTGNKLCKEWFAEIHDYTWAHFKDNEYPEWYGYLTRQGTPLFTLKGGKWKGCFHVPRALFEIWKTLEA